MSVKKREGGSMCQALKELLQDERVEGEARMAKLVNTLIEKGKTE